ncbi:ATP-binding protein [Dyadobacter sp.]|uniref:ATP-binding protein n=1 Tax=Dyadobacter sp. TaxID=1914288 RepID=UPI003F72566E
MKILLHAVIFLVFSTLAVRAQDLPDLSRYKTTTQKLEALADICDSLNRTEGFEREKVIAGYALKLVPAKNWYYLSLFNFNLGIAWEPSNSDSGFYFHEKSLEYARKANHARRINLSLERLLFNYTNTAGKKKQSDAIFKEMLTIMDSTSDELVKASLAATIGNYYSMKGAYETQIKYLLESIVIKKKLIANGRIKDREAVVVDLMNLAELYIGMAQGEKGIMYSKEARNYMTVTHHYRNHFYKDMTDAYLLLKQPANAQIYFDSLTSMLAGNTVATRRSNVIAADLAFADYYLGNNKPDSAMRYVREANELAPKWASEFLKSQVDYITGTAYLARKEYSKALPLLEASEPLCKESGLDVYAGLLQALARCYAATGQWQKAYNSYDKYAPIRDSLYIESAKKSIADAEAQYQNQEKQQQIEIKNIQIDDARKQRMWLTAGIALMALSLALLGIIYRNKKKNAELLDAKNQQLNKLIEDLEEANRTKAKLFSIISHDLRSPISQVYQFLKLQQLNPKLLNETQRAELSEKIQTATGSLLETMEDLLLWSKTQMNQFKADIQPVDLAQLTQQCIRLLQLNIEAKQLSVQNLVPEKTMLDTDPYYLQAILRNLLQNAIKASDENSTIRIEWTDNLLTKSLSVENSGTPFSQEAYQVIISQTENGQGLNGLGLRLIDELSSTIGLQIHFENPKKELTRAVITV